VIAETCAVRWLHGIEAIISGATKVLCSVAVPLKFTITPFGSSLQTKKFQRQIASCY